MSNFDEKLIQRLTKLEREVERLRVKEKQVFVPLTTPLTSTSWDGDARSTTAKTKIDLSVVFGVPAGVKAVLVKIRANDSGSPSNPWVYAGVGANNVDNNLSVTARPAGLPSWYYSEVSGICACDANGDIYFQCLASGTGTMEVHLQIWGYWL